MSDSRSPDNDPSMDDILASIRKIISDDEARAQVGGQPGGQAAGPADGSPAVNAPRPVALPIGGVLLSPAANARAEAPPRRDDVLLLTDLIEEPSAPPRAVAPPTPLPRIYPVNAAEMPQPNVDPMPERPTPAPSALDQSLVGSTVAGATSSAFERLNQAMQESVPPPAASDPGPAVGAGGKTIEDMVKEMLRPMLKEWLDKNLPPMVERFVEREIVRLTRR